MSDIKHITLRNGDVTYQTVHGIEMDVLSQDMPFWRRPKIGDVRLIDDRLYAVSYICHLNDTIWWRLVK